MADAVVNFLVENLLQLISENVELIRGADDEFKHLLEEVQRLKAFLDDAAKYHSESSQWDLLVKEIQRTVHKAEDAIDKFLVQSKQHRERNKVGRFFDKMSHVAAVRALAAEINGIQEKVKILRENNREAFQPKPVLELPKKGYEVIQGPSLEDDEVVGFDEEANKVIKRLVEGPAESLDIIPVVGMPGLGKTTLARKICNDPKLSYEFFSIIWVYIGQEYKIKDIFLTILKFFKTHIEDLNDDMDTLVKAISDKMSRGGRCLIVLDDVWAEEVINHVRRVFPQNKKGHRIMMTTRERHLAIYANPDPHDLKFLTKKESFELLVKRVFGNLVSCPEELVGLGKKIAESCGGVPLAVVVIAGALRGRPNKVDWARVEKNVGQHLFKNSQESCLKFVEMSYDRLPQEMQTCLLYSSVFPRGFDIPSWKLIRLWIAEGLIKPQQPYTVEEIAEFYLNDLVNRSLVILLQKRSDGQIKTCRLHDMLHEFCRTEASNKLLFQEMHLTSDQVVPSIPDIDTCRRLCIKPSIQDSLLFDIPPADHVRSLYCFSSEQKQIELSPNDIKLILKAFPLIRVLDVEPLKIHFSRDFNQLYHLRYVAISGDFKALPPTFRKFWNLQTLVIKTSTSESTLDIKADIWNLLQLRHLHTNIPAKLPPPATTTGNSGLQTLSMVAPESCKKDVLAKACHLKKLSIRGQMAAFLDTHKGGISNLEELKCLEHLKLLNDVLYMNKVVHLPAAFFRLVRTVKKLTLANTRFSWSDANRLAQLESLEVLKLKENAFMGDYWEPETGGFSLLQVLWIERSELESWEASPLHFPILRHLILISCNKLKVVPLGLADIHNFQEMRLDNTSKSAVTSAKAIESKKPKLKLTIFPPETDSKDTQ